MRYFTKQLIIIGVVLSIVAGAFFTIETVSYGSELTNLKKKEVVLIEKNRELVEKLAKATSTSVLDSGSTLAGFDHPKNVIYVANLPQVASRIPFK